MIDTRESQNERKSMLLRLPAELHQEISEWAWQDHRSITGQIVWLLERLVDERRSPA